MKRVVTATCLAAAFAVGLAAQSTTPSTQTPSSSPNQRGATGPRTVTGCLRAGDKEGENFSWEIASALNAGGWRVFSPASTATLAQSGKPFGTIPRLQTGVVVSSNKDEPSMKAADALVRELSALGFDARKAANIGSGPEPIVVVTVQARPEGAQGELKLNAARK